MAKLAFVVVLTGVVFASGATRQIAPRDAAAGERCRVSSTNSHPVPGRPSFNFGNARIAVDLRPGARFVAIPDGSPRGGSAFIQRDGWIRAKVGWFTAGVAPRVTGRRVEGTGRRLRAHIGPASYSTGGTFYPSLLYFASFGCWRLTATAGDAHLSAIVYVTH